MVSSDIRFFSRESLALWRVWGLTFIYLNTLARETVSFNQMSYSVRWTGGPEEHLLLMDNWMRVSQLAGTKYILLFTFFVPCSWLTMFYYHFSLFPFTGFLNRFYDLGIVSVIPKVLYSYIVSHQQSDEDREAGLLSLSRACSPWSNQLSYHLEPRPLFTAC